MESPFASCLYRERALVSATFSWLPNWLAASLERSILERKTSRCGSFWLHVCVFSVLNGGACKGTIADLALHSKNTVALEMWMNKRSSACFSFEYIFISSQAEFWTRRQCTTYSINVTEHMVWITRNVTELSSRDTMRRTWTCECGYKWPLRSKHIDVCQTCVSGVSSHPAVHECGGSGVINPRAHSFKSVWRPSRLEKQGLH